MKKFLCALIITALTATLAACGGAQNPPAPAANAPAGTEAAPPAEAAAPEAAAPSGETYDTGNFSVLVPAGWKAFPQHDLFSDDKEALDPDMIRLVKGGEKELDEFSKPSVMINYYGPSTTMVAPDKEFYDNTQDVASFTTGSYTWTGFSGESIGYPLTILTSSDGKLDYQVTVNNKVGDSETISIEDADVLAIMESITATNAEHIANK